MILALLLFSLFSFDDKEVIKKLEADNKQLQAEIKFLKSQIQWADMELMIWQNPAILKIRLARIEAQQEFEALKAKKDDPRGSSPVVMAEPNAKK